MSNQEKRLRHSGSRRSRAVNRLKFAKFAVLFPAIGKIGTETGSHLTASATIQSLQSRYPCRPPKLAGFSRAFRGGLSKPPSLPAAIPGFQQFWAVRLCGPKFPFLADRSEARSSYFRRWRKRRMPANWRRAFRHRFQTRGRARRAVHG